jgi:plasmid stability protein
MATIMLQNVPDALYRWLCDRATQHGRSIEEEAMDCLDAVVSGSGRDTEDVERTLAELRALRGSLGGLYVTEAELQKAKREGRP